MFVKICGITRPSDAVAAADAGADAIGLNFVAGSSRQIDVARAQQIIAATPGRLTTVGVFRDHSADEVLDITDTLGLHAAQLHGDHPPEDIRAVDTGVPILILAMTVQEFHRRRVDEHPEAIVMLDGPTPGSGVPFDWASIGDLAERRRILLAGGLRPDNVADAIRKVRPWGVDVATGVESAPGLKDPAAIAHFVQVCNSIGPS